MEAGQVFETLMQWLQAATFLPFAVPFVVAATALAKRVIPAHVARAGTIALALQVIVWVVWVIAREQGYGASFTTWLDALTTILGAVTMVVVSAAGTHVGYEWLKDKGVPLFGQGREV